MGKVTAVLTPQAHKENIIFYFPYREVGGVSTLFVRLGAILAAQRNVFVVDFPDGYMSRHLPENVTLIPFGGDVPYPDHSVFIFQSVPLWNIADHHLFPSGSKIIFWNLFPYNLNPNLFLGRTGGTVRQMLIKLLNLFSFPRRRKLDNLIEYLLSRRALLFMDGENLSTIERLFFRKIFNPTFMPVITDSPSGLRWENARGLHSPIQAAWVGRVEDFKVPILKHLLARLDVLASDLPVTFMVIGGGGALPEIQGIASKCNNLNVVFRGEYSLAELSNVLTNQVDILFAMGTSALEGARYGVPTVLLDYSYSDIVGTYRFQYIYSVREHTLGEEINSSHLEPRCTLRELFDLLSQSPDLISQMCRTHWELYHSPNIWVNKFLASVDQTEALFEELRSMDMFSPDWATILFKRTRNRFLIGNDVAGIKAE